MIYHSVSLIDEVRVYEMEKIKQKKKEIIKIYSEIIVNGVIKR